MRLSRHRGVLSNGLRIEHSAASMPEFVVFWAPAVGGASRFRRLKVELESSGYRIDD